MANILKSAVRGHIRVVLGIQGELWLLCVLINFKIQQFLVSFWLDLVCCYALIALVVVAQRSPTFLEPRTG